MDAEKWMKIAKGELNIKEIAGLKNNPRILEYHKATSLKASSDEISWCSSFVNWVMLKAGLPCTNLATARSWLNYGKKVARPQYGAIVVLKRGKLAWQGHVGFVVSDNADGTISVLGGNQSNKVCILKFKKSDVVDYRLP